MSQAAESSIHRDEYTHYKESTYGMTIPYRINYHVLDVLAIADVASISGLFRKAFVSVLVSICIPEKISCSLLQSYGILWVSLEMGQTLYPQNCYLYRLAYWYTPKLLFLLGKSGEDDGSPMDLGKTKRCIVCMKNHRSQIETSKDQGYGSPLLWAGKSRKAVWDNISHKRLRVVETWEVLNRKHLIYFHKIMDHDGKHKTCPILFVPLMRGRSVGELFAGQKCRHLRDIAVQVGP